MAEATDADVVQFDSPAGSSKLQLFERNGKDGETVDTLVGRLKDLDAELEKIARRKYEILNQSNKSEDVISPKARIIGFVQAIERANQYFDFLDFLKGYQGLIKHDSDIEGIFKRLVKEERVQDLYNKLDFQDIMNAIDESKLYLIVEQDHKGHKLKQGYHTSMKLELSAFEERAGARLNNPIIDLAFRIRKRGYVMHEDPLVELDRIREDHPTYYNFVFRGRLLQKYSEKKVKVGYIPAEYDEDKIKAILQACGCDIEEELEMIDMYNAWSKAAYVTFSSAEGAKLAPFLCEESFSFSPVAESPVRQSESREEFIKKFEKAMSKYKKFRNNNPDEQDAGKGEDGQIQ